MDELLQLALLGTNARPAAGLPATTPAADQIAGLTELSFERQVLLAAAARSVYEMAGTLPQQLTPSAEPMVAVAPPEKRPYLPPPAAAILRELLIDSHSEQDVLGDLLAQVNQHGLLLSPELLPLALNVSLTPTRRQLLPILGERGRWLARLRSDWSWALAAEAAGEAALPDDIDEQWEAVAASTPLMRREFLQRIRQLAPARVRQWVAESLPHERADHRAGLLEVLRVGFSTDDLELVESCFTDRSLQVRTVAARLAALVSDSSPAQRASARAESLVQFEPTTQERGSLLKKLRGKKEPSPLGTLTVTPPAAFDAAWAQDGLVEKTSPRLGARAWWLRQLVRVVPLTYWTTRFPLTPEQLIELAAADEFGFPLIWGWSEAALFAEDTDWLLPLWRYWARPLDRKTDTHQVVTTNELTSSLFAALPADQAEACALEVLQNSQQRSAANAPQMLPRLQRPWSAAFSHAYLQHVLPSVAKVLADNRSKHNELHYTLPMAAAAIAETCLPEAWDAAQALPVGDADNAWHRHLQESLVRFQHVIALRRRFRHELQQ